MKFASISPPRTDASEAGVANKRPVEALSPYHMIIGPSECCPSSNAASKVLGSKDERRPQKPRNAAGEGTDQEG